MMVARAALAVLLATGSASCGSTSCLAAAAPPPDCAAAAAEAEAIWALPENLLLAIGLAETGLRDQASGQLRADPFSVNVGGADVVFASAAYAIGAVAALRGRGVRSIDVGCFQINLQHHPEAFASLPDAFDPRANARYAGFFLRRLFERFGSWDAAVAAYHSADPARGGPYRDRVFRFWRYLGRAGSVAAASGWPIPVYTPATLPAWLRGTLHGLTKH